MPCTVVVGGFFGDEGKGKIIAYLARRDKPSVAVRGGVGPNAGHTFTFESKTYKVRMLPSAVLNSTTRLLVGAGVLIDSEIWARASMLKTGISAIFLRIIGVEFKKVQ